MNQPKKKISDSQSNQNPRKILLEKKIQLIRLWSCIFFGHSHTCIVDFVAYLALEDNLPTQDCFSKFYNYQNILTQLKQGFILIDMDNKKIGLNFGLINNLHVIIQKIKKTIKVDMEKHNINSQKERICKQCQKPNQIAVIQLGFGCKYCKSTQFKDVKHDLPQKQRLEKVQDLISKVIEIKQNIQKLQHQFDKAKAIQQENQKQKATRKVTSINQFMNQIQKQLGPEKIKLLKLQVNAKIIQNSQRQYAPKINYKRIIQLKNLRKKRKLMKIN